jgi:hypothetical protein
MPVTPIGTITAANSVYMLTIPQLYPIPQQLVGYAADAAFETEASAGFVPFLTKQGISIMPDSPSAIVFEDWLTAQKSAQEIYSASAVIYLPSISRSYIMTNGVLTSTFSIPGTRKVLQARTFTITWGDITPVPV